MLHKSTHNTDRKGAVASSKPFDSKAITKVVKEGIACVQAAKTMEELKAAKTKYAGAQSAMTLASKSIGSLQVEEKKEAGKIMSALRADFGREFAAAQERIKAIEEANMLQKKQSI